MCAIEDKTAVVVVVVVVSYHSVSRNPVRFKALFAHKLNSRIKLFYRRTKLQDLEINCFDR